MAAIDRQRVGVVIVTHNSGQVIGRCLHDLFAQTRRPDEVVVVDSGSADTAYLKALDAPFRLVERENIGFCAANNIGYRRLESSCDLVLLLNPDAFLFADFIATALRLAAAPEHARVGCFTGLLLGYSAANDAPTGLVDSSGIFRTGYGRWFDRGKGLPLAPDLKAECLPAICGALMFCRTEALRTVAGGGQVFDESFYMYKEDIDLSLRLRERGYALWFDPTLRAYHCRGWQPDRKRVSRRFRLMSARNEIRLYRKHPSPYIAWAIVKYLVVRFADF